MTENFVGAVLSNAVSVTILAAVVFVATRIYRHAPIAHFLWLIVLVKMVMPPVFNVTVPINSDNASFAERPSPVSTENGNSGAGVPEPQIATVRATDMAAVRTEKLSTAPLTTPLVAGIDPLWVVCRNALVGLWIAGTIVIISVTAWRILRFRRLLFRSSVAAAELQNGVARLVVVIGLRTAPSPKPELHLLVDATLQLRPLHNRHIVFIMTSCLLPSV